VTTSGAQRGASLPREGDVLAGKYRIERVLGQGGMGIVYAAYHELLAQQVALKLLLPEIARHPEAVSRFLHEARAAARIQGDHVARVMDVGTLDEGLPYIVLELLQGLDLGQVLVARETLPVDLVIDYVMQALEALAQAHALGIVHRDIKPSNLFLARTGDGSTRVKVLDFGISKTISHGDGAEGASVTATNAVLGSPAYMSPEQLRNSKNVDVRTDVWSIGVVLYELLTGRLPFHGENVVDLFAAISETVPRAPSADRATVPLAIDEAVMRCLERSPADRFGSVTDLAAALAPYGSASARASLERIDRPRVGPIAPKTVQVRPLGASADLATLVGAGDLGSGDTLLALTPPSGSTAAFEERAPVAAPHVLTTSSWSRSEREGSSRRRRLVWFVSAVAMLAAGAAAIGMLWGRTSSPGIVAQPAALVGAVAPPPVEAAVSPSASAEPDVSTASALPSAIPAPTKAPVPLRRPVSLAGTSRPAPSGPPSLQDPIFGRH